MTRDCVFCDIAHDRAPATYVRRWTDATAFVPLNPVTDGHVLVVPNRHVADAVEHPEVTAATMLRAAELAATFEASNILTSIGAAATQSVFHLHIHVIRRAVGDQLMVPWGTTGNPHDPHWCRVAAELMEERDEARAAMDRLRDDLPTLERAIRGIAATDSRGAIDGLFACLRAALIPKETP